MKIDLKRLIGFKIIASARSRVVLSSAKIGAKEEISVASAKIESQGHLSSGMGRGAGVDRVKVVGTLEAS